MPDPVNTVAPVVSGGTDVGDLLTCAPGSWTNSPTEYDYQWQRETGVGSGVYADIPGELNHIYRQITADVGRRHDCVVTASNLASPNSFAYWAGLAPPSFTPLRTVTCTTVAQFQAAWAALLPGDFVNVNGVHFTDRLLLDKRLADWAEIHFNSCTIGGTSYRSSLPSVALNNVQKIRFFGLDITNPAGGAGMIIFGGNSFWWDMVIHECAATGLLLVASDIHGGLMACKVDVRPEVTNCGLDEDFFDPHAEKGSGLHGVYAGDDRGPVSGRIIANVHDQPKGAAIQAGPGAKDIEYAILAERITFDSFTQTGGNAIQFWGDPSGQVIHYLEADTCHGRAVSMAEDTTMAGSRVEYGRATNMLLSDSLPGNWIDKTPEGRVVYDPHSGMSYVDVLP